MARVKNDKSSYDTVAKELDVLNQHQLQNIKTAIEIVDKILDGATFKTKFSSETAKSSLDKVKKDIVPMLETSIEYTQTCISNMFTLMNKIDSEASKL